MAFEYAVMEQVAEAEPRMVERGFINYEAAHREENNRWDRLPVNGGFTVYTVAEAERAAKALADAKATRYYVTRREVGEWQGEVYE